MEGERRNMQGDSTNKRGKANVNCTLWMLFGFWCNANYLMILRHFCENGFLILFNKFQYMYSYNTQWNIFTWN